MKLGILKTTLIAFTILTSTAAVADWKPSGPIKLMIAFKAGGGVDTSARLLAEGITASRGWQIIPENVAGGGGATMAVALKAEPKDGLSWGMTAMDSLSYGPLATKNPGYALGDFSMITTITGTQTGLIAKKDRGWANLGDVIADAKAGKKITAGAMSVKLSEALYIIGKRNGVEFTTVMVKGGKGGLDGVVADDLDIAWAAGPQTKGVLAGDLINLVSGEEKPLNISPDAPMMSEYGVDYFFGTKFGLIAPAGVSDEARAEIAKAAAEVINNPESKLNQFITKAFSGPETLMLGDFDDYMTARSDSSKRFLKEASE